MNRFVLELGKYLYPIHGQYYPASQEDVSNVEQHIGVQIPPLLRDILTTYGEAGFNHNTVIDPDVGETLNIDSLYGCTGEHGALVDAMDLNGDYKIHGMIPFGCDVFGDTFVWCNQDGGVYFVDYTYNHETIRMAPSLEDFILRLRIEDDPKE